jgi:hypothetical protein
VDQDQSDGEVGELRLAEGDDGEALRCSRLRSSVVRCSASTSSRIIAEGALNH